MTIQNYLVVESNTVTNIVLWDGNVASWTPPEGATMLVKETTPANIWEPVWSQTTTPYVIDWVISEQVDAGGIGFTWDGTILTTNEPKPPIPNPPTA
jgi:hypothetical protein